jgi:hypothetical protein
LKAVSFATLLVRGVALWLVCNGVSNLGLIALYRPGNNLALEAILTSTLLPILTGLVVWSSAAWLATRMAGAEPASSVVPSWTPEEGLRVAVAITGLVIFAGALRDVVWHGTFYVKLYWPGPGNVFGGGADGRDAANLVSALVRAALGAFFILSPTRVVAVVGRAEPAAGPPQSGSRRAAEQRVEADER